MRKCIGLIALLLVIALLSPNMAVYAANDNEGYAEYPNDDVRENEVRIVIRDAEGNIVETHELGRQLIVNGAQYTIPSYGSLTVGTYYASTNLMAGFYFIHGSYPGYATSRNRKIAVSVRQSSTLHGVYTSAGYGSYSTNEENNLTNPDYYSGVQPGCSFVALSITPSNNNHYFEVSFISQSSLSTVLSILISRD